MDSDDIYGSDRAVAERMANEANRCGVPGTSADMLREGADTILLLLAEMARRDEALEKIRDRGLVMGDQTVVALANPFLPRR